MSTVIHENAQKTPTDEQQAILLCKDRYISVQAGPGTGKTFTLCRKIEKLLENHQLQPTEKILFCTYTNALTSNNLKSISENEKIDFNRVHTITLDSFLVSFLQKLDLTKEENEKLKNFEDQYQESSFQQFQLLNNNKQEISVLLDLAIKRYPYVFLDEIQDIREKEDNKFSNDRKIISPKYYFLELIKNNRNLEQLIIVGDDNQSLKQGMLTENPRFDVQNLTTQKPFRLTKSMRNDELSGSSPNQISSLTYEEINQTEALARIKKTNSQVMIILRDFKQFKEKNHLFKDFLELKSFIYGAKYEGQHVLPQAIINSICWYQDLLNGTVKSSLESTLLPFKGELLDNVDFSFFKMRYYTNLEKEHTFDSFLKRLLTVCNKEREKVKKLNMFYQQHSHLYSFRISDFKSKVIVTTIDSSKGLEADEIYYFENGNKRSENHIFVAHTRHKQKLHVVQS
jgi:superfamily I DNA/RNA helicase